MIDLIERNIETLRHVCRRRHVKSLELFGSATDGTFDAEHSDLDFLLEFLPEAAGQPFHGFFELKEELEHLFGRKVDLVMPAAIRNPCLLQAINKQRQVLDAA